MAWIDYKKTNDLVPKTWINNCLKMMMTNKALYLTNDIDYVCQNKEEKTRQHWR